MDEKQIKFYKSERHVQVYTDLDYADSIFKKYLIDYDIHRSREELKEIRKKLMAIKHCQHWPEFVIKPKSISRLNAQSFTAEFPFIEGIVLDEYLLKHDMSLLTCAQFISSLEKSIMDEKNFIFPDIANVGNIMILPQQDGKLHFRVIDPDGIQFDGYGYSQGAAAVGLLWDGSMARGLEKCFDERGNANKQLDIRSMYSLFYIIMNGEDCFYPIFSEKAMDEYLGLLNSLNVPSGSSLYQSSLETLSDDEPNREISSSLFELIDAGYEFEIYNQNSLGNQYRLTRKSKKIY